MFSPFTQPYIIIIVYKVGLVKYIYNMLELSPSFNECSVFVFELFDFLFELIWIFIIQQLKHSFYFNMSYDGIGE